MSWIVFTNYENGQRGFEYFADYEEAREVFEQYAEYYSNSVAIPVEIGIAEINSAQKFNWNS